MNATAKRAALRAAAVLLSLAAAAPAGELDKLLAEVKPPARFKDHRADFRVITRPHIKPTGDVGAVTTLTVGVDPVLGYVIDRHTKWRRKILPAGAAPPTR